MSPGVTVQQGCPGVPIDEKNQPKMSVTRILFIESDPAIFAVFALALKRQSYIVDWAISGAAALSLLTDRHFDLAVLNRSLSDMDGCMLCGRIRKMNHQFPLLMLAAEGRENMLHGFEAGADDYMPLPADDRELLARVRVLMKRASPLTSGNNKLRTGDIVLDNDSKEVCIGSRPVAVTAMEFLLLEYMMKNKNRVVTREELASAAWRKARGNKPENLAVQMNKLRKKLQDGRCTHFLYTVSGKGYLLAEKEGPEA